MARPHCSQVLVLMRVLPSSVNVTFLLAKSKPYHSAALKSNHFKQSVKQIKQISKKFISNKQIPILRFDLTFDMFDAALSLPWQTW